MSVSFQCSSPITPNHVISPTSKIPTHSIKLLSAKQRVFNSSSLIPLSSVQEVMGLPGWYSFLRKKGYQPDVLYPSAVSTTSSTATRRVAFLSRFAVIRHAYIGNPVDNDHEILEQDIKRFGTTENTVVYVDGSQAKEKEATAQIRREARQKAIVRCKANVGELQGRIENNLKVRKSHFTDVQHSCSHTSASCRLIQSLPTIIVFSYIPLITVPRLCSFCLEALYPHGRANTIPLTR